MSGAPRWMKAVVRFEQLLVRSQDLAASLQEELLWALLPPSMRVEMNAAIYAGEKRYIEGNSFFEHGLQYWEERVLERKLVPRTGRVLVGGAGGGRELAGLLARGFRVSAFDPCAELVEAARRLPGGSRVLQGSYADLVRAGDGEGPLAALRADAPFSLVLLGWRSLSHVLDAGERAALFAALPRIAPGAPVIASFLPRAPSGRLRHRTRAVLRRLGATPAPEGALFLAHAGFAVALGREELAHLAQAGGYAIDVADYGADGFVLLVPRG